MEQPVRKVQLVFQSLSAISSSEGLSVITLSDMAQERALVVVCDQAATQQFEQRLQSTPSSPHQLPEVLWHLLEYQGVTAADCEMLVYDVSDGQYAVVLCSADGAQIPIRMSDAILLNRISHVPIYMLRHLFERQSSPYNEGQPTSVVVPINIIQMPQLNEALQKALSEEDYRLAARLQAEIDRRTKR